MCAVIDCQIGLGDVTEMNSRPFVSATSRKPIVPKLLNNKRAETKETIHVDVTETNFVPKLLSNKRAETKEAVHGDVTEISCTEAPKQQTGGN